MKYAAIAAHVGAYTVAFMCRVLGVAPSGYYAWIQCPTSRRKQHDNALQPHVRAAFQTSKQRYGSPRIHAELRAQGHCVSRKRVARLMRESGLRARPRRRFRHTTLSKHREPIAPNIVARQFEVTAPNQVWVSDLTYLPTLTGFVYLAVILDLFARRVVGWAVSDNLDATVAVTALQRALGIRPAPAGLVHHSDRGVHYACADYRGVLEKHGVRRSMSRKGNCWDNAVAESFFSSLKFELEDHARWSGALDAEHEIGAYIDGFYNSERRHSHNRYFSPIDFEHEFVQQGIAA